MIIRTKEEKLEKFEKIEEENLNLRSEIKEIKFDLNQTLVEFER